MNAGHLLAALATAAALSSCSSLTVPGKGTPLPGPDGGEARAREVLERSSTATGKAWQRYGEVRVGYDGEWTGIVKRLQPELVDAGFRKSSVETYRTRPARVHQTHTGPSGAKTVVREPGRVRVERNGQPDPDPTAEAAAALVADAYTAFLFGGSWLAAQAEDPVVLAPGELGGETCERVQGVLRPGFGQVDEDRFIAWIGRESGLLRRLQFSIDGLASTRGADVDVVFTEHWKAADGSIWPGRFVERVRRPLDVKAHEWTMTSLELDGRRMAVGPRG